MGATGTVWKATAHKSKESVAVKMLNPNHLNDKKALAAFAQEYKLCKQFDHKGLLHYFGQGVLRNTPYIIMEYFPSVTLKACIAGDKTCHIFDKAHTIMKNTAAALRDVHQNGLIHRDIKPDNILVNPAGDVKLIDFSTVIKCSNLSQFLSLGRKTSGTPSYISPEQIANKRLSPSADIYSFGATLFELLTGRPPFISDTQDALLKQHLQAKPKPVHRYNREVSTDLDKLISSMLAKDPDQRPRDMAEVCTRLSRMKVFQVGSGEFKEPGG